MRPLTSLAVMLCLTTLTLNLDAQESEKDRTRRIEKLQRQLAEIQKALAEEGVPPTDAAAGAYSPEGIEFREIRRAIKEHTKRIEDLKEESGADSREVAAAKAELKQMQRALREMKGEGRGAPLATPGLSGGPFGDTPGFPGAPFGEAEEFPEIPPFAGRNPLLENPKYMERMMEAMSDIGGQAEDPYESTQRGQQMVLEGLQIQFNAMAELVRDTDGERASDMRKSLRKLVEQYVEARRAMQEDRLMQLTSEVAAVKKEIKESESVDEILNDLVGDGEKAKDKPEKKAQSEPEKGTKKESSEGKDKGKDKDKGEKEGKEEAKKEAKKE